MHYFAKKDRKVVSLHKISGISAYMNKFCLLSICIIFA